MIIWQTEELTVRATRTWLAIRRSSDGDLLLRVKDNLHPLGDAMVGAATDGTPRTVGDITVAASELGYNLSREGTSIQLPGATGVDLVRWLFHCQGRLGELPKVDDFWRLSVTRSFLRLRTEPAAIIPGSDKLISALRGVAGAPPYTLRLAASRGATLTVSRSSAEYSATLQLEDRDGELHDLELLPASAAILADILQAAAA